jgi:hypothetical protein
LGDADAGGLPPDRLDQMGARGQVLRHGELDGDRALGVGLHGRQRDRVRVQHGVDHLAGREPGEHDDLIAADRRLGRLHGVGLHGGRHGADHLGARRGTTGR